MIPEWDGWVQNSIGEQGVLTPGHTEYKFEKNLLQLKKAPGMNSGLADEQTKKHRSKYFRY